MRRIFGAILFGLFCAGVALADEPIVVPFVSDPSPMIDGNLREWTNRGVLKELNRKEQVTFGAEGWKGPSDLSGWARVGYDNDNLYIACHVIDDYVTQQCSGNGMWQGDHVMGIVDFVRRGKKVDLIQFGISPGSLKAAGIPGSEIKPDFVIFEPQGMIPIGAVVAASKNSDGYDIEAAIPWKALQVSPIKYQTFGINLAFSDCDSDTPHQDRAISIGTAWNPYDPKSLYPAGLGDRTGFIPADAFQEATLLAKELTIAPGQATGLTFNVASIPEGRVPTLSFKGRAQSEYPGGCCGPMLMMVNGKNIAQENIANRPRAVTFMNGGTQTTWYGYGITLWYGADFESIEKSGYKPLDVVSYDYTLRLDKLIEQGKNTISLKHMYPDLNARIVMADVAFSWSPPSRFLGEKILAPAPTGSIPTYEPWTEQKVAYKVVPMPGGAIKVAWQGSEIVVESRFSKPDGDWAEWKADKSDGWDSSRKNGKQETSFLQSNCGALTVSREVIPLDECVLVRDTLKNNSGELLPLLVTHQTNPGPYAKLWLSGRPIPAGSGSAMVPENPSVVVLGKDSGFALLALDDVFRLHLRAACDAQSASLGDNSLVIKPGVTYVQEWMMFPLPEPDYWHYANAARRFFKTNFTIPGSFAFYDMRPSGLKLLPSDIKGYLDMKNALFISGGLGAYKGLFPHGPNDRVCDPTSAQESIKKVKALRPATKTLMYFNCFDCARAADDPIRWPECRIMGPDGHEIHNGAPYILYFPTLTNEYGREMDKSVDWLLNVVGSDGLYQDCYNYNLAHYGEPWDGWTADIDPTRHTIIRQKSSVSLITWPWRERLTARLQKEGRPHVANGNPVTTSEMKYHFPRFVETADISALAQTHLFTPIALGDHITERNEVDSYRWMLNALDWGGVYYYYPTIIPTHPTLTTYMFPLTPMELHSGYIIGRERILTKLSGLFGWGDASQFEVHVFDRMGKETKEIKTPRIMSGGKAYAELRIPEGYSAAIVRK